MNKVGSAVVKGLAGVLQFKGRSSRTDFWVYAIFVFLLALGLWGVVMAAEMSRTFVEVQQYADAHPDKVTITSSPSGISYHIDGNVQGIGPDFKYLMACIAGIALVSIALLAAAAVRRLHDANRTGLWILLPLPFLFGGFWLMSLVFHQVQTTARPQMGLFALGFVNNLVYLATVGFVTFLLLRSGSSGENRFGERNIAEAT
ncbi:DUF805 domain-containing protein [Sphingorhabdus contaminans]|jgi:uncharacterized membrane protein YhaH (DUF805 family)|uniref:DUF805 domain-containing protein n=1 Tax=Sphingorhabdus contaminans TaxID=1343899 RepID=A0A553WJ03_9SPHN|nr:DUF805 domain-containing protein [Sphingorhabdus contaminans]TSB04687.1 DUF805 domain-containing protein [Sphingorhabdus contaminans]